MATITNGSTLPAANCACTGAGQCAAVSSANFSTDATGQGSATLNGTLSALPFGGLTNQTCFNATSLGTATDSYRVRTWLIDRQIAIDRQLMCVCVCVRERDIQRLTMLSCAVLCQTDDVPVFHIWLSAKLQLTSQGHHIACKPFSFLD